MVLYTKGVQTASISEPFKKSVDATHSDPKNRLLEKWFW
jgi:hypothetical protein